jgi:hypothetical protein
MCPNGILYLSCIESASVSQVDNWVLANNVVSLVHNSTSCGLHIFALVEVGPHFRFFPIGVYAGCTQNCATHFFYSGKRLVYEVASFTVSAVTRGLPQVCLFSSVTAVARHVSFSKGVSC